MNKDDVGFWRWVLLGVGYSACAFLGFFGLMLFFPGLILLIAAIAVATKLEDFDA